MSNQFKAPPNATPFAVKADQTTSTSTSVAVNPGVQQYHPSAAKAWVRITGTTSIIASYNISSVTQNAAGDFTLTFTVPFTAGTAYTFAGMGGLNSTSLGCVVQPVNLASPGVTTCRFQIVSADGALMVTNTSTANVTLFGGQ